MEEERSNTGLWAGLIVFLVAAIVFLVLWYLRGGEITRLNASARSVEMTASSTQRRLEDDLRRARSEIETGSRRISELEEQLRDEQRRAGESVQQAERRLRLDLDAANARLQTATDELAALQETVREAPDTAELELLREEYNAVQARVGELTSRAESAEDAVRRLEADIAERDRQIETLRTGPDAMGDGTNGGQADALQSEIARLENELAEARQANEAMEALRTRLAANLEEVRAESVEREATLLEQLEEARQQASHTDAGAEAAERLADVQARLAAATGEAEQLRSQLREMEGALQRREAELRRDFEEQTSTLRDRLREMEKKLRDAPISSRRNGENPAAAAVAAAAAGSRDEQAQVQAGSSPAGQRSAAAGTKSGSGYVLTSNLGKPASRVVEIMGDGFTCLISGGSGQRMAPGMKFAVHRPDSGRARFVGMLKIIRSMDNYSMAVPVENGEVRLCEATGRAVLDPAVRVSPFARTENGQPVQLVRAENAGHIMAVPTIGDYLDNPFYCAERRLVFAIPASLARAGEAKRMVEILGGLPCVGTPVPNNADYVVADAPSAAGYRQVTLAHLSAYADPAQLR